MRGLEPHFFARPDERLFERKNAASRVKACLKDGRVEWFSDIVVGTRFEAGDNVLGILS